MVACAPITGRGFFTATPVPPEYIDWVRIPSGQTLGMYITIVYPGGFLQYTHSVGASGDIFIENAELAITVGAGVTYPFGTTYPDRLWNGSIRYNLGLQADRLVPVNGYECRPSQVPSTPPIGKYPSDKPSINPSRAPTVSPSMHPSTSFPSRGPTLHPMITLSDFPSQYPSKAPTVRPSQHPTSHPAVNPSIRDSGAPTILPTQIPSDVPSYKPSNVPSASPSLLPSLLPSLAPTMQPSIVPSKIPSNVPSDVPSNMPSYLPTDMKSGEPSIAPSVRPTTTPSSTPTISPSTIHPTPRDTLQPTITPTNVPTMHPSKQPTREPVVVKIVQNTAPPTTSVPTQSDFVEKKDDQALIAVVAAAAAAAAVAASASAQATNANTTFVGGGNKSEGEVDNKWLMRAGGNEEDDNEKRVRTLSNVECRDFGYEEEAARKVFHTGSKTTKQQIQTGSVLERLGTVEFELDDLSLDSFSASSQTNENPRRKSANCSSSKLRSSFGRRKPENLRGSFSRQQSNPLSQQEQRHKVGSNIATRNNTIMAQNSFREKRGDRRYLRSQSTGLAARRKREQIMAYQERSPTNGLLKYLYEDVEEGFEFEKDILMTALAREVLTERVHDPPMTQFEAQQMEEERMQMNQHSLAPQNEAMEQMEERRIMQKKLMSRRDVIRRLESYSIIG